MNELDLIRSIDFDWTMRLADVWSDDVCDAPELHANIRAEFAQKLESMRASSRRESPLGWIVVGDGGSGKTHLLGTFRREAARRKCAFVLVDMTDVRNFWETVLQGYLDSLQQAYDDEISQSQLILRNIIDLLGSNKPVAQVVSKMAKGKSQDLQDVIAKVLDELNIRYQKETLKYQNIVRALICLNSKDFSIANIGTTWLQGQTLADEDKRVLGFTVAREQPKNIVEALSWFMSLSGPTVLAFDQLDPIIAQLHYRNQGDQSSEEQATAKAIIVEIGGGLSSLRDLTSKTLTIVCCVESTVDTLKDTILKTFIDRFEERWRLVVQKNQTAARSLVQRRLEIAFKKDGVIPKYPTYPFKEEAFGDFNAETPREILKKCEQHRRRCLRDGVVHELRSFVDMVVEDGTRADVGVEGKLKPLDEAFDKFRAVTETDTLLEEKFEDERLAPLLRTALECLLRENELPPNVDSTVDVEFTGGATTRPLHARLRLMFRNEKEREEHYCVRALQLTNAKAYQSRLKAAMTQAGIDRTLAFRRLSLVRTKPIPGGAETEKLTRKFQEAGGVFLAPTEGELRTIFAVHELKKKAEPNFEEWLKARRPISQLKLIRDIAPIAFDSSKEVCATLEETKTAPPPTNQPEEVSQPKTNHPVEVPQPKTNGHPQGNGTKPKDSPPEWPPIDARLPLGRRVSGNTLGEMVKIRLNLLEKHTLVLAGAGSGKTVLLKRLIEESLILGIPSIVIDSANDLAALDEKWESPPAEWEDEDHRQAERYHRKRDVVIWTPGKESGNPLAFEPLPDLAPLSGDNDELESAISMACESLATFVAPGNSQASQQKRGILSKSLRYLAQNGGGKLERLIELLGDFPVEAGLGVANETKLAQQIADSLKVQRETNPMLRSLGTPLDPAVLFGDDAPSDRTRISVINLVGLPGIEAQRYFLNQLAMTLFSWIKKNPDPGARPLRGLLVIDEAKDFAPSQKASTCGDSLLRLVAQARKYHLGLIFATQNPKDIDNRIMANASTHFYGKVNSPVAIETVRELLKHKGASGEDVPRLPQGRFYVHNADADLPAPVKISIPLCLSRHPNHPLDESSVLEKAIACRRRMVETTRNPTTARIVGKA